MDTPPIGPRWTHTSRRSGPTRTVVLSGELDLSGADELAGLLADETGRPGTSAVRVDLAAVTFLDSCVISVLIQAHLDAAAAGRRLTIENPRGHVHRVLDITGVLAKLSHTSPD